MMFKVFLLFVLVLFFLFAYNRLQYRVVTKEEFTMQAWQSMGRFLTEFLALGMLFVSAYISMILV